LFFGGGGEGVAEAQFEGLEVEEVDDVVVVQVAAGEAFAGLCEVGEEDGEVLVIDEGVVVHVA
jgi:hypothetical protein